MTDREKYGPYIGKPLSWVTLKKLGIIAEVPQLERAPALSQRTCDECASPHYARGKCLSHYNKDRRRSHKASCTECGTESPKLFRHATAQTLHCPSCVQKHQPFDQALWTETV